MRYRVAYAKREAMRFTGHLDLYRAWERLIRRAQLPLAYTQGYNPHPRLNLSPALPLGFTSECELIDIWLEEPLPLDEVLAQLKSASPPGIRIQQIQAIDDPKPAVQKIIASVEYVVTILEPPPDLTEKVEGLLSADRVVRTRRNKPYDLRSLIEGIEAKPGPDNSLILEMRLVCQDGATGRPDEVLKALDFPPNLAVIHRTRFFTEREKQLS